MRLLALTLLLAALSQSTSACPEPLSSDETREAITRNLRAREETRASAPSLTKIAIDNVKVFDGRRMREGPQTVVIDGSTIGFNDTGVQRRIDATGFTLLPGFTDAHCHPSTPEHLQDLTVYGVTTAVVMACYEPQMCTSLQGHPGLVNIVRGSAPAAAPHSVHGNITTLIDPTLLLNSTEQIPAWVERQLAGNPDFIKIIAEEPGLSAVTLKELTEYAKSKNVTVAAHASALLSYTQAVNAHVHHIQHAPLDIEVNECLVTEMKRNDQTSTPTLTMMRAVANNQHENFQAALQSTTLMHKGGVTIMAGTDANLQPGLPASVPFGTSLHDELQNLVEAGMSNLEALRAATSVPARQYGMYDRGVILPGMRADLVMIEGNPLDNITATRSINKVWVGGLEY